MNLTHDRFSSVVFFYITFAIDSNDPIREGFFCELRIVKSVNVVPRTPSRFIFVCVRFDNKLSVESFPPLVSCFQLKSWKMNKRVLARSLLWHKIQIECDCKMWIIRISRFACQNDDIKMLFMWWAMFPAVLAIHSVVANRMKFHSS